MPSRRFFLCVATVAAVASILLVSGDVGMASAGTGPAAGRSPGTPEDGQATATTLRVGIKPLDPFVTHSGSRYEGFSIELWDEIARRNAWTTSYVWYDTLPPLLEDVVAAKIDIGIAGISMTPERETRLDFSHPIFNSGLQVLAARQANRGTWLGGAEGLASTSLVRYLGFLIVVLFVAGNLVWLADRTEPYLSALGRGMFRAAAVGLVGEVGEQDRPLHRFASVVWVVLGISFVSLFTASLATELTVQQITGGISGIGDLPGRRVVTITGSTAAQYLATRRIAFEGVPTVDDAFAHLNDGSAEAMVFDAPVLQHYAQRSESDRLMLAGSVFQREDYGIALPQGSALRKTVNATLLEMRADGTYDRLHAHYFGPQR